MPEKLTADLHPAHHNGRDINKAAPAAIVRAVTAPGLPVAGAEETDSTPELDR